MRPFLGLPVSQKKRNVRSSRSAKNGSKAPVASGGGVAQWPLSPMPPAAMLANGGVGALPGSQKKGIAHPVGSRRRRCRVSADSDASRRDAGERGRRSIAGLPEEAERARLKIRE